MSGLLRGGSSPLSICFHPSAAVNDDPPPPSSPPPPTTPFSGDPNPTTTCVYHTHLGLFSLSWSQSFLRRSFNLHFYFCHTQNCYLHSQNCYRHSAPLTFGLDVKPFTFWRKQGSKKISQKPEIQVVWDLARAKLGSRPEPESGFYIAVVVSGEMGLLVGDSFGEALKQRPKRQVLVSRTESLFGNSVYCTKTRIKGKPREIRIDFRVYHDANLRFSVDNKRVLQVKRLKWKFRGNEKIEVDGVTIQISWDVYNWLFGCKDKNKPNNGHAVFTFRFENPDAAEGREGKRNGSVSARRNRSHDGVVLWQQDHRTTSFPPSSSSSNVMEWANCTDEEELSLGHNNWFSLLVYAWRK